MWPEKERAGRARVTDGERGWTLHWGASGRMFAVQPESEIPAKGGHAFTPAWFQENP